MSVRAPNGFFFVEIAQFTVQNCQPFRITWLALVLALTRYTPQVITFLMYFIGLFRKELYLLVFGIGLSIDSVIGAVIGAAIGDEIAPRVETCTPVHSAAVAYQVQHASFFLTFSLGYMALYRPRVKFWHLCVIFLFYLGIVLGAHHLNYYSADAVLSGAALGSGVALVYQSLIHWFVVPHFPTILSSRINRYLCYADNLCTGTTRVPLHILMVESYDEFVEKQMRMGVWVCSSGVEQSMRQFIASQAY